MSSKPKIIVILGPTASGKSDLAVKVAKYISNQSRIKISNKSRINGGEIISADSRQVYKGLDIGSGKVPKDKKIPKSYILNSKSYFYKGVPHHLLDVASPKKTFSAAQYQKLGKKAIKDIIKRGKMPIICGGTGFYIDSLIYDYKLPEVKPNKKLRAELEKKSAEELFKQLKKLDPERAENIDKHNKRRLVRALEIVLTTKEPVPKRNTTASGSAKYDILKIGVKLPKEELRKNINKRVDKMIRLGLVNETKKLLKKYPQNSPAFNSIGYKEIIDYLENKISLNEAVSLIKKNTRQYAKRQMTWFKRDKEIIWINSKKEKRAAERLLEGFLS